MTEYDVDGVFDDMRRVTHNRIRFGTARFHLCLVPSSGRCIEYPEFISNDTASQAPEHV